MRTHFCLALLGALVVLCSSAPSSLSHRRRRQAVDCTADPCKNGATCANVAGGYTCTCPPTFVGNDCELECGPVDIAFVLDTSGSITLDNWNNYVIPFCKNLIGNLTIGDDNARIGATGYSDVRHFFWALDKHRDAPTLLSELDKIDYSSLTGYTNTPDGLKSAQEQIFDDNGNRAGVPDIAIVFNDGYCNCDETNTCVTGGTCPLLQQHTDELKNFGEGVKVYVMGIGSATNRAELQIVASEPDSEFLLEPQTFAEMDAFVNTIALGTCKYSLPPDPCLSGPCLNGGQCTNNNGAAVCTCAPGYTGNTCQTDIDDCAPNPCQNGGVCTDQVNGFTCACSNGFTGTTCQTPPDPCLSNPCINGGQCINGGTTYTCQCINGYTGTNCGTPPNPCLSVPCLNGGQCSGSGTTYTCQCINGFTGSNCGTPPNPCLSSPCLYGGQCVSSGAAYICQCTNGYTGSNCQTPPDPCQASPCLNSGICSNSGTSYTCNCINGYTGSNCQTAPNPCASLPCLNNGFCSNSLMSFTCTCAPGFTGNLCQTDIDDCSPPPCLNGGLCTDKVNGYSCACPSGFSGNNCEIQTPDTCVEEDICFLIDASASINIANWPKMTNFVASLVNGMEVSASGVHVGAVVYASTATLEIPLSQGTDKALVGALLNNMPYQAKGTETHRGFVSLNNDCFNSATGDRASSPNKAFLITDGKSRYPSLTIAEAELTRSRGVTLYAIGVGNYDATELNAVVNNDPSKVFTAATFDDLETIVSTVVGSSCKSSDPCSNGPCLNGGACFLSGATYTCGCVTGYTGSNCEIPPSAASCDGEDVCFLVDASASINIANWPKVTNFLQKLTNGMPISPAQTHVGVVVFASTTTLEIRLSEGTDRAYLANRLPQMVYQAKGTETNRGLAAIRNDCFNAFNGDRSVPNKAFLITDGKSRYPSLTISEAQQARNANIDLFAIGVGNYDIGELNAVVNYDNSKVFTAATFDDLETIVGSILAGACPEVDPCGQNPCVNGGACNKDGSSYTCTCVPGYAGTNCQTNINECASSPCLNGGACIDKVNGYFCQCPSGFGGFYCEIPPNPCASAPCQNAGVCSNSGTTFFCLCANGYTGNVCEIPPDPCGSSPCYNGGACSSSGTSFACTCINGFTGNRCQFPPNPCASTPCLNGGVCSNQGTDFYCTCANGYTGTVCQTPPDPCASGPCMNGGVCSNQGTAFMCTCANGFTGTTCETPPDPCASGPCMNGGVCSNQGTIFMCTCANGYTGTTCETPPDPCASAPCLNGGVCSSQGTIFMCTCANGFTGNTCQTPPDPCLSGPCLNGGACANSGTSYTCTCLAGFTGTNCQTDIDECASSPCLNGGACANNVNSFSCICSGGFTGTTCEIPPPTTTPSSCFSCSSIDPTWGGDCQAATLEDWYTDELISAGLGPDTCTQGCYVREVNGVVTRGCGEAIIDPAITAIMPSYIPDGATFCYPESDKICFCQGDGCSSQAVPTLPAATSTCTCSSTCTNACSTSPNYASCDCTGCPDIANVCQY